MRYLLVTHIPFAMQPGHAAQPDGSALLDALWAEDLRGLAAANGPVTVAAPAHDADTLQSWGTSLTRLSPADGLTFLPLPVRGGRLDLLYRGRLRRALHRAVDEADLVHTSNLFGPDTALYAAHDIATRRGVKTLFVVAEDFVDMLGWEWVRTERGGLRRWRAAREVARTDRAVRARIRTASLTFLHTPAAVARYRLDARNAIAIRQPVHEAADVISVQELAQRLGSAAQRPLQIVAASRLRPLKGLDFLVRAIGILRDRGIPAQATLYGSGDSRDALTRLIARLHLTDAVQLPGPLPTGPALRSALQAADVFAMPHLTTDFGRAFFDAVAAGLPVVAFRSAASEGTVRDGVDGLLAPMADAEALAAALGRFAGDAALLAALSRNARTRALENTRSTWNALRAGWIRELFDSPLSTAK